MSVILSRVIPDPVRRRSVAARLIDAYSRIRNPDLFASVRTFCMFIGHGRSGSTIVGALLNAHPDIVLSNELGIFNYSSRLTRSQLFNLIHHVSQRQARRGSKGGGGYSYHVPSGWQGAHRTIRVIGDRKAGWTAYRLFERPELLAELHALVDLPLRFIAVVRNPFDTLSTTVQKTERRPSESDMGHIDRQVQYYFERVAAIEKVCKQFGSNTVKFVHHDDLISDASRVLNELCAFLGVVADESYLSSCTQIVRPQASITRNQIEWSADQIATIERRIREVPWLRDYQFGQDKREALSS